MARRKKKGSLLLSLIAIIILAIGAWKSGLADEFVPSVSVSGSAEIHIVDVGQADCTLILTDNGNILIDAGDIDTKDEVAAYLKSVGVSHLAYAVFTHPDADHIGGAATVLRGTDVENVILPVLDESDVPTTKVYEEMLTAIEEDEDISVLAAKAGDTYELGDLKFEILAPLAENYSNINNYSVCIMFDFGNTSMLFTGDALEQSENQMLKNYSASKLKADFFQAGHHGASNANTVEFMRAVSPKIVAVSCGADNKYGHPTEEALAAYAEVGAMVYRTDELGTLIFVTDGKEIVKR